MPKISVHFVYTRADYALHYVQGHNVGYRTGYSSCDMDSDREYSLAWPTTLPLQDYEQRTQIKGFTVSLNRDTPPHTRYQGKTLWCFSRKRRDWCISVLRRWLIQLLYESPSQW